MYLASEDAVLAGAGMLVAASVVAAELMVMVVLLMHSFGWGKAVGQRSCWVVLGLAVVGTSLELVAVVVGIGFDQGWAWPFGKLGVVVACLM